MRPVYNDRPEGGSGYARRRIVRVPASSANLGPGFDCMAAALALHLELEAVETGEFVADTYRDFRRRVHRLTLEGRPARIPPAEAEPARGRVRALWTEILGDVVA